MGVPLDEITIFISHKKNDSKSQEIKSLVVKTLKKLGIKYLDSDEHLSIGQNFSDFANKINSDEVKIVMLCCSQEYYKCYEKKIGGVGAEAKVINMSRDSLYTVIPVFKDEMDIPDEFSNVCGIVLREGYPLNEHEMILEGHMTNFFNNLNNIKIEKSIESKSKGKAKLIGGNPERNRKAERIMELLNSENTIINSVDYDITPVQKIIDFLNNNAKVFDEITTEFTEINRMYIVKHGNSAKKKLIAKKKVEKQLNILIKAVTITTELQESMFAITNTCSSIFVMAKVNGNNKEIKSYFDTVVTTYESIDLLVDSAIQVLENLSNFFTNLSNIEEAKISMAIYADVFNKYSDEMNKVVDSYNDWLNK